MKMEVKVEEKKTYTKPETKMHKAASIVSGSNCSQYAATTDGAGNYWH